MPLSTILSDNADAQNQAGRFRLPAGPNLCLSLLLSILAVAMKSPLHLAAVAGGTALFALINRPGWRLIRSALRAFIWQTALLLLLHWVKFGEEGIPMGLKVSCQLFLAFLPGSILMTTINRSDLVRITSRILPPTGAFVLAASLHFVPLLIGDIKTLHQAQVLRGARILPRDILNPCCWKDFIGCLMVPATVQAFALAGEIAMAARVRDFGASDKRTCWPGDSENKGRT